MTQQNEDVKMLVYLLPGHHKNDTKNERITFASTVFFYGNLNRKKEVATAHQCMKYWLEMFDFIKK